MPTPDRRSAMKVQGGRPLRKNNRRLDHDDYFVVPQREIGIDRRDPGRGYRHLITVAQLRAFVELLPDWDEVAVGLRAIVLDCGGNSCMGWHQPGVVAVCGWEQEIWSTNAAPAFVDEHRSLFDLLDSLIERAATHSFRRPLLYSATFALLVIPLLALRLSRLARPDLVPTRRSGPDGPGTPTR